MSEKTSVPNIYADLRNLSRVKSLPAPLLQEDWYKVNTDKCELLAACPLTQLVLNLNLIDVEQLCDYTTHGGVKETPIVDRLMGHYGVTEEEIEYIYTAWDQTEFPASKFNKRRIAELVDDVEFGYDPSDPDDEEDEETAGAY